MVRLRERLRRSAKHLPGLVGMCAVVYFGYHAIQGDRGLLTLITLDNRVASVSHQVDVVKSEQMVLAQRVSLMRPASLDRDMLEEQVRLVLNYTHPNDVVIQVDER
ncbi:MAG: septum formation initiator family protein [Pseudomonadota bacterium]